MNFLSKISKRDLTHDLRLIYAYSRVLDVIYEQRERVFHRDIQTRENNVRARVVYMASQMNRDVTECFRLLT